MRKDRGREHEGAPGEKAKRGGLAEKENAAYGAKKPFHGKKDRRVRRGRGPLRHDLQGEGDASGEEASVQDGDGGRKQASVRLGLENKGGDEAQEAADRELARR